MQILSDGVEASVSAGRKGKSLEAKEGVLDGPTLRENSAPPAQNNVHSKDFESKIDDYFTSKTKVKDSGRKCSIKIFGQWT